MYIVISLNHTEIFDIFRSMGEILSVIETSHPEVELNFQTSRDALDEIYAPDDSGEERNERLKTVSMELVMHQINIALLPETVSQSIRDKIPTCLVQA